MEIKVHIITKTYMILEIESIYATKGSVMPGEGRRLVVSKTTCPPNFLEMSTIVPFYSEIY